MFSEGLCEFQVFDPEWEYLSTFGQCGDGPGDYSQSDAAFVIGSELWVFQRIRMTVADLSGEYKRTASFVETPIVEPVPVSGHWIGRSGASSNKIIDLDVSNATAKTLFVHENAEEVLRVAGAFQDVAVFYGSVSSKLYVVNPSSMSVVEHDLGLEPAEVTTNATDGGVVRYWTTSIVDAWGDDEFVYLMTREDNPRITEDFRAPKRVRRYGPELTSYDFISTPEDFPLGGVNWSEDEVVCLDRWASRIHVYGK